MATLSFPVGTAPTEADLKELDMAKVGQGHPVPDPKLMRDVQGQCQEGSPDLPPPPPSSRYLGYYFCPHCGALNYFWESPYGFEWYHCWKCRGLFRA